MKIAVLGWGSLLWNRDKLRILPKESPGDAEFDAFCDWSENGPVLPLEFSRISQTRGGALTLVIDEKNGTEFPVWFAVSQYRNLNDALRNLRNREQIVKQATHYIRHDGPFLTGNMSDALRERLFIWLQDNGFDAVIWTGLASNFKDKTGEEFDIDAALKYLVSLDEVGESMAKEYMTEAPRLIQTPVRMNARRLLGWQV